MRRAAVLCLLLAVDHAQAGVYLHVDPVSGMTILNNLPPAGGAAPVPTAVPVARMAALQTAAPGSFPRVTAEQQKQRDGARRTILQEELDSEQQALAGAAARRAAADVIARHSANVAALKRELAGVR